MPGRMLLHVLPLVRGGSLLAWSSICSLHHKLQTRGAQTVAELVHYSREQWLPGREKSSQARNWRGNQHQSARAELQNILQRYIF